MPQFTTGNMWSVYDSADLFLITTNSALNNKNELVMGAGIALQTKQRFPSLPKALGKQIQTAVGHLGAHHLLVSPRWPVAKLGCFQVKYHWQQPADLNLIRQSTIALKWWAWRHHDCQIHLNFPGIGYGRLEKTAVLPILSQLPENVTIWEYAKQAPLPP